MGRTVFKGGRVFDGSAELASADIAVEDGRIVDVGPGLDGDEAVELAGRAVLPGLFDCHTHVMVSPDAARHQHRTGDAVLVLVLRGHREPAQDARHRHHDRARRRLRRPRPQDGRGRRADRGSPAAHRDQHPVPVRRPRRRLAAVRLRHDDADLAGHAARRRRRAGRDAAAGPRAHPGRRRPDQGLHLGRGPVSARRPATRALPGRRAGRPGRGGHGSRDPGHVARAGRSGDQVRRAGRHPQHRTRDLPRRRGDRDDARARHLAGSDAARAAGRPRRGGRRHRRSRRRACARRARSPTSTAPRSPRRSRPASRSPWAPTPASRRTATTCASWRSWSSVA